MRRVDERGQVLVIFAVLMTAFCLGLFRYALDQPIPVLTLPGFAIEI